MCLLTWRLGCYKQFGTFISRYMWKRYALKLTSFDVFPQSCRCLRWVIFFWSLFFRSVRWSGFPRGCVSNGFIGVFFQAWDGQISHGIVMCTQKWLWYNVIYYRIKYFLRHPRVPDKTLLLSSLEILPYLQRVRIVRWMNRHACKGQTLKSTYIEMINQLRRKDDMWIQVWVLKDT